MNPLSIFSFESLPRRPRPRELKAVALAALLLLAGELGLRFLVQNREVEHPRIWHSQDLSEKLDLADELAAATDGLEVVFTGNSRAEFGFNPRLLQNEGISAFNFGLAGISVPVQCLLVREVIVPRYRPRVLVWGVTPRDLNAGSPYIRRQTEQILSSPAEKALNRGGVGGWFAFQAMQNSALIAYRHNVQAWLDVVTADDCPESLSDLEDRYALNSDQVEAIREEGLLTPPKEYGFNALGHRPCHGVYAGHRSNYYYKVLQSYRVSEEWRREFAATLAWCRGQGVEVLVVNFPSHPAFWSYTPRPEDVNREYLAAVTSACRQGGATFIDYEPEAGDRFGNDCFRDPNHLNFRGSRRLTRRILAWLKGPGREALEVALFAPPAAGR